MLLVLSTTNFDRLSAQRLRVRDVALQANRLILGFVVARAVNLFD